MGNPSEALAAVDDLEDPVSVQAAIVRAAALVARGDAQRGSEVAMPIVETTIYGRRCWSRLG
jgi:hypothetical protein